MIPRLVEFETYSGGYVLAMALPTGGHVIFDKCLLQRGGYALLGFAGQTFSEAVAALEEWAALEPSVRPIRFLPVTGNVIDELSDLAEHWGQMGASREAAETIRDALRILTEGWTCTTHQHTGACEQHRIKPLGVLE